MVIYYWCFNICISTISVYCWCYNDCISKISVHF